MIKKSLLFYLIASVAMLSGCKPKEVTPEAVIDRQPTIFPDYTDVTIAPNLVPPRFWLVDNYDEAQAIFTAKDTRYAINAKDNGFAISQKQWDDLKAVSDKVDVTVMYKENGKWTAFAPFSIIIAPDSIDRYIAYRLIEPGYESWNEMGIYQRDLQSYQEDAIITNSQTDYGCINCHSFCRQSPDKMLMHTRVKHGGTYVIEDGEITKLNTKTPETISALVYPSWHPSGDYVAFSVNNTKQLFHTTDPNRIEVFDYASDVVVYDVNKHEIISSPLLKGDAAFETFPTFSPDGTMLYFCTADSVSMPDSYDSLRYNICAIAFDPINRRFGTEVDTLYNAVADGHSASFPRVSPDGRWLMFTKSDYGTFSIWHHDADLYMADLENKEIVPLDVLNSDDTESYHMWSNNGRWVVFSSRRLDGLYTRPYLAYIDQNGVSHKPLLLPPPTRDYYQRLMKSYNVPEFITGPVKISGYAISKVAKKSDGIDITMHK